MTYHYTTIHNFLCLLASMKRLRSMIKAIIYLEAIHARISPIYISSYSVSKRYEILTTLGKLLKRYGVSCAKTANTGHCIARRMIHGIWSGPDRNQSLIAYDVAQKRFSQGKHLQRLDPAANRPSSPGQKNEQNNREPQKYTMVPKDSTVLPNPQFLPNVSTTSKEAIPNIPIPNFDPTQFNNDPAAALSFIMAQMFSGFVQGNRQYQLSLKVLPQEQSNQSVQPD